MTEPAPLQGTPNPAAPGVIVVYHDGTDADAVTAELAATHGFTPRHVFRSALLGFAAELSADALAAVRRHPAVKYVEHDGVVRMM
ncbi:MAG TPA: protease inhibitor I9 family protein [Longimicrobium sp.]|nr:protease inhibitor I9 family protein [Longimicrobium sp.]